MRRLILTAAMTSALSCCAQAVLPEGASILPESAIAAMLNQCSRGVPERGQDGWRPGASDIVALERGLGIALASAELRKQMRVAPQLDLSRAPDGWRREYVGLVRAGRRFIYGNFRPDDPNELDVGMDSPTIVCDGGPDFFGVEYDVEAARFTHFAFNGAL